MDLVNDICTFVKTQLPSLYATLTMDNMGKADEALMIRGDPSTAVVEEFIDGSTTGEQQVTFYARSMSNATAKDALYSIWGIFNQPKITLTDALCIRAKPVTMPAFVNEEESGAVNYSMTVSVEFDAQNKVT